MTITMRPYAGESDFPLIVELVQSVSPSTPHIVDQPWRMSSPIVSSGHDAVVWEDEHGILLGYAAWQLWWAALDYFVHPGPYEHEVETQLYSWAEKRFRELDQERGKPLPYWVEFRDDDPERRAAIERHGFTRNEDYSYVQLSHPLSTPLPEPTIPEGFTIRSLGGPQEVAAYVALHRAAFESTSMTVEWRQRTLKTPQYKPELDLVAIASDGTLAGFCVGWLEPQQRIGQIEPVGIHPRFQHRGLGRALLLEILHRFKAQQAERARVETQSYRQPALRAYESVGFRAAHKVFRQGKYVS